MHRRAEKITRRRAGQAMLEYILLMAALSVVSIAFSRFINEIFFGVGFEKLPQKVTLCVSHMSREELRSTPCQ